LCARRLRCRTDWPGCARRVSLSGFLLNRCQACADPVGGAKCRPSMLVAVVDI
jgi:hypothetical protein